MVAMTESDADIPIRGRRFRARDPPVVDERGVPSKCLSLVVSADWGHFRRIDRTVTKQTYRVPPRTTIAGLLAGVVGVDRDAYYEVFADERSAIAVELLEPVRTMPMGSLGLSTNPSETFESAGGTGRKTVQVRYPDSTTHRQRHGYHYLVEPSYRIDVAVEHRDFYGTLRRRLQTGTSYYPPSMGLSELLASVEWVGEYSPTEMSAGSTTVVDSILPDAVESVVPSPGESYAVERVPGCMIYDGEKRLTTEFVEYAFRKDGSAVETTADDCTTVVVDGRTVVFR